MGGESLDHPKNSGIPGEPQLNIGDGYGKTTRGGALLATKEEIQESAASRLWKKTESAWGSSLHDDEAVKGDARGGIKAVNTKQHLQLSQDSTAPSSTVSTLESDLNSRITEANLRRKEDAEVTKRELA